MRIYLSRDFRHVSAGKAGILKVQLDNSNPEQPRYYIEAPADVEQLMRTVGILEGQTAPDPRPVSAKQDTPEKKQDPAPALPVAREMPEAYFCTVHNKEHKRGSSQYVVCFDKNFSKPVGK